MKENAPKHSWNGIDLDKLRHVMDPPADAAMKSLYRDDEMDHLQKELGSFAPVSELMIPMLTVYFRQGKKSGFRNLNRFIFHSTGLDR